MIGSRRLSSTVLWTAALLIAYLVSRLAALTVLPIFFDETGHIRWAIWISQGQKLDKPWQYGKGLQIFANALLFPWAREHYLWASRALAVLFGAGTLAGAVLLGRALAGARAGWLAGAFYIACPYAVVYDRLALTDPALATCAVFAALLCLRLADRWRIRDGAAVGLALALGVFAKALGVLLFFAPAAAVLLVAPTRLRRPWPLLVAYALAGGLTTYALIRYFEVTATVRVAMEKSDATVGQRLAENLPLCATWLWTYWTPPLVALALLALAMALRHRAGAVLFAAVFIVVPACAFAGVGDIWFPRYLVFLTAPFAALAATGADALARVVATRWPGPAPLLLAAGLVLVLIPAARADWLLLVAPPRAPLVELDRFQYVTGWPSGYGVRDTVDFVRAERARHPEGLRVVTHARTVRTTARALDLEFAGAPDVQVDDLNFDHPSGALPLLADWARERPTLVVLEPPQGKSRRPDPATFGLGAELAARTFKPDGTLCDEIYRLCGGERCPAP